MENVIATLPMRMAKIASKPRFESATEAITIKSAARECFQAFSDDEGKSATRVQMVLGWVNSGFVVSQIDQILGEALLMAKEADIASGFTSEGKKGRAAYGTNQSVMASRASECRSVFGAATQGCLPMLKEKGWQSAVNLSRMWLNEKNVLWDGATRPTKEQREAKREAKEMQKAHWEAAKKAAPIPGETPEAYAARIAAETRQVSVNRVKEQMLETMKKWDQAILMDAIHEFLLTKSPDDLRMMAAQLQADADELEKAQDIERASRSEEPAPF